MTSTLGTWHSDFIFFFGVGGGGGGGVSGDRCVGSDWIPHRSWSDNKRAGP